MFKDLMETTCRLFESLVTDETRDILRSKYGLTATTISNARIGFAPVDATSLLLHLFERYDRDLIINSGLFYQTETALRPLWRGRLMFPYLVEGSPMFFIGRKLDDVTTDGIAGKYVKQKVNSKKKPDFLAVEPVFGVDTVKNGEVLIIAEGITDCIACHQAGFPAISPVTTSFKQEHAESLSHLCERVSRIVIITDNEVNESGILGAVRTAFNLGKYGINSYIGELPRPEGVDKVDIADYCKFGGDLQPIIDSATLAFDHPKFNELKKEEHSRVDRKVAREMIKTCHLRKPKHLTSPLGYTPKKIDIDVVKAKLPTLTDITGIPPGHRGPHPVYGSSSGKNLEISVDGERWFCYHEGNRGEGDVFKWIAVYELNLIREDMKLDGPDFVETLKYAWKKVYRSDRQPDVPVEAEC